MHPYKIYPKLPSNETTQSNCNMSQSEESNSNFSGSDFSPDCITKSRSSTQLAVQLRHRTNLSLSQALMVIRVLEENLNNEDFSPPTRQGLNKADNKFIESEKFPTYDNSVLQFDGKTYPNLYGKKRELMAICYGQKLIGLKQIDKKKSIIFYNTIKNVLDTLNLVLSMVICDTEPTNTRRKSGVVTLLKNDYHLMTFEPCRLHVLDLVLKHQFEKYFDCTTVSSDMPNKFGNTLKLNWAEKVKMYQDNSMLRSYGEYADLPSDEERREDYQLLLKLVKSLRFYRSTGIKAAKKNLPNQPPSTISSRWNSRAIYSLFSELIDGTDSRVYEVNSFIIKVSICHIKSLTKYFL